MDTKDFSEELITLTALIREIHARIVISSETVLSC